MGFKESLKQEMKNATNEVDLSVTKTWSVTYEGHSIQVENSLYEEVLLIDGVEIVKKRRTSIWSHVIPTSKLVGELTLQTGETKKVEVKFSGLVQLHIQVKVGKDIILKEKMKIEMIAPWEQKEALVPWITQQIDQHGRIVSEQLPDEKYLLSTDVEDMSPGYRDLLGYEQHTPFYVKNLIKLIEKQIENPSVETRKSTYEKILEEHVATYGAELIHSIKLAELNLLILHDEARWFLEHAAHREVVKFALLVIGCTDYKEDEEYIQKIALHSEFMSYATFPLRQAQERLWEIADQVTGWGKILLMQELIPLTDERKVWFLEQTWDDEEKVQASALIRAEKSELDILLYEDRLSTVTFQQISQLISTLIMEIDDTFLIEQYEHGPTVLKHYVRHAMQHQSTELISQIETFLSACSTWDEYEIESIQTMIVTVKKHM